MLSLETSLPPSTDPSSVPSDDPNGTLNYVPILGTSPLPCFTPSLLPSADPKSVLCDGPRGSSVFVPSSKPSSSHSSISPSTELGSIASRTPVQHEPFCFLAPIRVMIRWAQVSTRVLIFLLFLVYYPNGVPSCCFQYQNRVDSVLFHYKSKTKPIIMCSTDLCP